MHLAQYIRAAGLLLWLALLAPPAMASSDGDSVAPGPVPSVDLLPEDVVRIVIEALAHNDRPYPDAGIATTYRFASPGNKAQTGPLNRFTRMVKGEPYGLMVNHLERKFSEVAYRDDGAYQMVQLLATDGRAVVYGFRLSRQQGGEFDRMWMTDAVWPIAIHQGHGPAL